MSESKNCGTCRRIKSDCRCKREKEVPLDPKDLLDQLAQQEL